MGGRLISRKGGDASGGIPSIDANDFVRDSGCVDSIFPQKEIGRPVKGSGPISTDNL